MWNRVSGRSRGHSKHKLIKRNSMQNKKKKMEVECRLNKNGQQQSSPNSSFDGSPVADGTWKINPSSPQSF